MPGRRAALARRLDSLEVESADASAGGHLGPPSRYFRAGTVDRNPGSIHGLGEYDIWGYWMTELGQRAVQVVAELTAALARIDNDHQDEAESEPTTIDVELIRVLASEPFELPEAAEKVVARAHQN
ncbi:hypothetical protein Ais01nite_68090 [Asanoa ishikariensis]|nr:hypothetical protein Ais01nite_68090 [Asanoa ishikariensis]